MKKVFLMVAFALTTLIISAQNNQQYKIGDYYDVNGIKGVIFKVDATGEHGLIVSLDKFKGKWSSDKKAKFETNAFFEDDGQKNMDAIAKFIEESGNSWSLFPYYEWCRNKGEGWYAPALDEMKDLIIAINGSIGKYVAENWRAFESVIVSHNGESLFGSVELPKGGKSPHTMFTSTEANKGKIYAFGIVQTSPFADPKVMFGELKKTTKVIDIRSRAIHKF